jgi:hypothetical protein
MSLLNETKGEGDKKVEKKQNQGQGQGQGQGQEEVQIESEGEGEGKVEGVGKAEGEGDDRLTKTEIAEKLANSARSRLSHSSPDASSESSHPSSLHSFSPQELSLLQSSLLSFYDSQTNPREMPWKNTTFHSPTSSDNETAETSSKKTPQELSQRAYEVWISEIMLQQTQVGTVKSYYTRWMSKWPDVVSLSQASIEVFPASLFFKTDPPPLISQTHFYTPTNIRLDTTRHDTTH